MTELANMTPRQRLVYMAKLRGRDTKPEMLLREFLTEAKVVFETYAEDLPGTPDIVVREARVVVFVHGCFWHHGCRRRRPKMNRTFWEQKFADNIARDRAAEQSLRTDGWQVLVVWECQVKKRPLRQQLLDVLANGRRVCHDCSHVAAVEYVHCRRCRFRYAPGLRGRWRRQSNEESRSDIVRRRRSLELCPKCGLPASDMHSMCPAHAKATRAVRANRPGTDTYRKYLAQGRCRCRALVRPGSTRCEKCLHKMRRDAKKRNKRYKDAGRCRCCSQPVLPGKIRCAKHHAKARSSAAKAIKRFIQKRLGDKQCVRCKAPSETYHCVKCRKKNAKRAKRRQEASA